MAKLRIVTDNSSELFSLLLEHLVTRDRECVKTMLETLLKGDTEYSRVEAHRLGGAFKNLAAAEAARITLLLERSSAGGRIDEAVRFCKDLTTEMDRIETFYRSGAWRIYFKHERYIS